MRIKLDENLPRLASERLRALGWDVHDVHEEGLASAIDSLIQNACEREGRVLITLPILASRWIVEPDRLRIRDHPTGA